MGDPSANAEQQILTQNLKSDVFLASHHGSDGSNSKTLLANINPSFAVISCGENNPYGHPVTNTLNRIKNTNAALFRTDKQGTIICTSNETSISWSQSPSNGFSPGAEATATATTTTTHRSTAFATTIAPTITNNTQAYVLNTSTKKFHYPYCYSASQISAANRKDVTMTRDAILSLGYVPCKNCNP